MVFFTDAACRRVPLVASTASPPPPSPKKLYDRCLFFLLSFPRPPLLPVTPRGPCPLSVLLHSVLVPLPLFHQDASPPPLETEFLSACCLSPPPPQADVIFLGIFVRPTDSGKSPPAFASLQLPPSARCLLVLVFRAGAF